jgi:phosphoribosylaminoimidazole-succinocarboxamide synthase
MTDTRPIIETDLPGLDLVNRGKVRDLYDLGEHLLIVTTDRVSAFDVILPTAIPGKGAVLTAMSEFWFGLLEDIVPHHLITTDVDAMGPLVAPHREVLRGRSMLVKKAEPILAECVVRGFITGSGWKDYQASGEICGIAIRPGMQQAEPFDEVLFTPATKAETGHDENIDFETFSELVGADTGVQLRDLSIRIYEAGRDHARERGIILADTKFEFGFVDGEITLIDEVLTSDSSRFWDIEEYAVGISPPSFDKQIVRDWVKASGWDGEPPAPALPDEVVARTAARYGEALERLTVRSYRARVDVRLDANVNDPPGNAVREGLHSLGHADVRDVRIGKLIELRLDAADADEARTRVERMCHELLANPVIESFEISLDEEA